MECIVAKFVALIFWFVGLISLFSPHFIIYIWDMAISGQIKDISTCVPSTWESSLSFFPVLSFHSTLTIFTYELLFTTSLPGRNRICRPSFQLAEACHVICVAFLILGALYKVERWQSSVSPILPPAGVIYLQHHIMDSDVSCVACTKVQRLNLFLSSRRPIAIYKV
jgi:hypothetical protein